MITHLVELWISTLGFAILTGPHSQLSSAFMVVARVYSLAGMFLIPLGSTSWHHLGVLLRLNVFVAFPKLQLVLVFVAVPSGGCGLLASPALRFCGHLGSA